MFKSTQPKGPWGPLAYAAAALAALFEIGVVWLMLHPQVSPDYRAYYLDLTTTCLNQPVSGQYTLGQIVSFRPDGRDAAKPLKVCGWDGPAGDGTHAVGTSSRLRFALPAETGALTLTVEMTAIQRDGYPSQRAEVVVNGTALVTQTIAAGETQRFTVAIPADVVARNKGALELTFNWPDAVKLGPNVATTYSRSFKLLAAGLTAA